MTEPVDFFFWATWILCCGHDASLNIFALM
jgi:hypothetical protein